MGNAEMRARLLKLMTERPDLPIIAMTDSDTVPDDCSTWWWSSIGRCGIMKVASWKKPDGAIEWFDDMNDLIEAM